MRIDILAIGRLARGAEADLAKTYAARASAVGKALALTPVRIVEVEPKKAGKRAEAEALKALIQDACLIACDERGGGLSSRAFADLIAGLRNSGERRLCLVVGGPDGLDDQLLAAAKSRLAFGPQTWPHALVRAMLAEQVYRAITILAGQPYHRD